MNENQLLGLKTKLTVYEAARWIAHGKGGHNAAESLIIEGINAGDIAANIIRWENGNINQMETTIKRIDLDELLKVRGCSPDADQENIKRVGRDRAEAPIGTTERNTLLTIIAALCDYSAIRHQDRGAAGKIAKMTEEIGAAVTDDTIRKVLSKIPDSLEPRMK